ncbi:MAG: DUF6062 family protein [Anaerolineae bacterium]
MINHKPSRAFYDVRDALGQPGCPICRLQRCAAERMIEVLIYEHVNDRGMRARIRKARGFCSAHTWLLDRAGAALGSAIISRDVIAEQLRILDASGYEARPILSKLQEAADDDRPKAATARVVTALKPQAPCPVCARAADARGAYLAALVRHFCGENGLYEEYLQSDGLCLAHFGLALARVPDAQTYQALVQAQKGIWAGIVRQLDEAIRKSDYRFKDEPLGEDGRAWLRALAVIGGEKPQGARA